MAKIDAILRPAGPPQKVAALAAVTSSAELTLGETVIFAINGTQDFTIKFGLTGMGAAAATDFRVPADQTVTLDTGRDTHIRVFNLNAASTADIYILPVMAQ